MPLVKIKATVRRMHDFQLQREILDVLADPKLTLIQWLPDVFQVGRDESVFVELLLLCSTLMKCK
jgi:hypothetical protein